MGDEFRYFLVNQIDKDSLGQSLTQDLPVFTQQEIDFMSEWMPHQIANTPWNSYQTNFGVATELIAYVSKIINTIDATLQKESAPDKLSQTMNEKIWGVEGEKEGLNQILEDIGWEQISTAQSSEGALYEAKVIGSQLLNEVASHYRPRMLSTAAVTRRNDESYDAKYVEVKKEINQRFPDHVFSILTGSAVNNDDPQDYDVTVVTNDAIPLDTYLDLLENPVYVNGVPIEWRFVSEEQYFGHYVAQASRILSRENSVLLTGEVQNQLYEVEYLENIAVSSFLSRLITLRRSLTPTRLNGFIFENSWAQKSFLRYPEFMAQIAKDITAQNYPVNVVHLKKDQLLPEDELIPKLKQANIAVGPMVHSVMDYFR